MVADAMGSKLGYKTGSAGVSHAAPITDFAGLNAVFTGGGTGMGRELTVQLGAAGCSAAICDVSAEIFE
jgi:hypothetical protein